MEETAIEGEQGNKLCEKRLRVQKHSVQTGVARSGKDVVVAHEEVYIERSPGSVQPMGEGEAYRIPVHEKQG